MSVFFKFTKHINSKKSKLLHTQDNSNFRLLIGTNSITQEKIFIPEKGLYQNILVTGTIGSR